MLTKNTLLVMDAVRYYHPNPTIYGMIPVPQLWACLIKKRAVDGNYYYLAPSMEIYNGNTNLRNDNIGPGICIGSSGTAPTEDDYTLGNQLTGFTVLASSPTSEVKNDNNSWSAISRIAYIIRNTTNSEMVVREIGRFVTYRGPKQTKGETAGDYHYDRVFMMDRSIFQNPVTIPVGGFGIVEYSFEYEIPTFFT